MQSIRKLGSSFWYMTPDHKTDRPLLGMVMGTVKTLMIDAGNSENHAQLFLKLLEKRQAAMPDLVVLTHWHWDHIFGLSSLKEAVSISSKATSEEIKKLLPYSWTDEALAERVKEGSEIEFCASCIKEEFGDTRNISITLPTVIFEDELEIDLGGVTCVLKHVGGDHAQDSVVIYIKEDKILFLADCIYPNIYAPKRNYTVERTRNLAEVLESFDADIYILSHWKPISKEEFNEEMILLKAAAYYTEKCNGNPEQMQEELAKELNRALNADDLETIEYFVNGYGIGKENY